MDLSRIIKEYPAELQGPVGRLVVELQRQSQIPREDFNEMRSNIADLTAAVQDLSKAQERTEASLKELAAAQTRTDQRLEALTLRVDRLAEVVEHGFKRLEART